MHLLLSLAFLSAAVAPQGAPRLTRDVTTQAPYGGGSSPRDAIAIGARAFFTASQMTTGSEVWVSDGTASGTLLPAETLPGPSGFPFGQSRYGNTLVYSDGDRTWRSDGTPAGTRPVAGLPFGPFAEAVEVGALLYGTVHRYPNVELWRTDLTLAGSSLVASFRGAHHLKAYGGSLVFFADDGIFGTEPWVVTGSTARLLRDIYPGPARSFWLNDPSPLPVLPGVGVFFPAHDGTSGQELFVTDGTSVRRVADINPGFASSLDLSFPTAVLGNRVLFTANDGVTGFEPWTTDGTTVTRLADVNIGTLDSAPSHFTILGTRAVFWADDGLVGIEPWITDGTTAGTSLLRDISPGSSGRRPAATGVVNGRIVFPAYDHINGCEPWASDGTPGGTNLLKDIRPGWGDSMPTPMAVANGRLLFSADDGIRGNELWATDGTSAGTSLLADLEPDLPGTSVHAPMTVDSSVLFGAGGELWRSDGSTAGTSRVHGGRNFLRASLGANLRNAALFVGDDGVNGGQLWRSDGTTAGTTMLRSLSLGGVDPWAEAVNLGPDVVVFRATDSSGRQLWRTDGTDAGTQRVTNLTWTGPWDLTVLEPRGGNRLVLFSADDGVHGDEPWCSDGTTAGTRMIRDINLGPTGSGDDVPALTMGSYALLAANDGISGWELWRTDGTAAGTTLVKDIVPGPNGAIALFYPALRIGDIAWFVADDGIAGRELWRTDGTAAGTLRVADIRAGVGSSFPAQFAALGQDLLFTADDGSTGRELWIANAQGVRRLTDLRPGGATSVPLDGGYVYAPPGARRAIFTAGDGSVPGMQLWWTDGTTVARHSTLTLGAGWQWWPHFAGGMLYLPAFDPVAGEELFALRSMAAAVPFGMTCRGRAGWPSLRATGPVLGGRCDIAFESARSQTTAVLALDTARMSVDLGAGCSLLLATLPVVVGLPVDAAGRGSLSLPVPVTPSLNGRVLFAQAAILDAGFGAFGSLVFTNGLQLVLGTE